MKRKTLEEAMSEAERFIKKAEDLLYCTDLVKESRSISLTPDKEASMYKNIGYDTGLNDPFSPSKRIAAVKRACIDLRNSLSDVTQDR